MEASAPKRRKTSPTSNVPVSGSDTAPSDGSGAGAAGEGRGLPNRRRRPSFASPTKASLARANPEILERREAQRTRRGAGARASSQPAGSGNDHDDDQQVTAQLEAASENHPASDPAGTDAGNDAAARTTSGLNIPEPRSPIRRPIEGMGARPRRSMGKPSPRPLPPPSAQEEELLDPFKGRVLRRSPPRGVLPAREPEEPELPPTPTEKGIADPSSVNNSPKGIHSSPSKQPRRSRALADKLRSGSSPLKQAPMRPADFEFEIPKPLPKALGLPSKSVKKTTVETTAGTGSEQRPRRSGRRAGQPHPARRVKEPETFPEKKEQRDALLTEVAQLEADLAIARKENERLHEARLLQHGAPALEESEDTAALLDVLSRHALPPPKEGPPDPSQAWLEAALDPMSFLPFGNPSVPLPNPFQAPNEAQEDSELPVSHHPIPMSSREELPFLQLFTPLVFSSTTTLVQPDPADEEPGPLMQHHSIAVSSTPRGLFTARVEMLVNTKTLAISELSVPKIDPAAARELAPFMQGILDAETGGPRPPTVGALRRNLGVLTWAMAEWTRLASKRARFWNRVMKELATRQQIAACVREMRTTNRKRRRRGRKPTRNDDSDSDSDSGIEQPRRVRVCSPASLFPLMGKTCIDLDLSPEGDDPGTHALGLRVEWKIGFDWTGEGSSTIGVLVQAPSKCESRD